MIVWSHPLSITIICSLVEITKSSKYVKRRRLLPLSPITDGSCHPRNIDARRRFASRSSPWSLYPLESSSWRPRRRVCALSSCQWRNSSKSSSLGEASRVWLRSSSQCARRPRLPFLSYGASFSLRLFLSSYLLCSLPPPLSRSLKSRRVPRYALDWRYL